MHPLTFTNSLSALLKLPWKLEINTDLGLYTRTGYADKTLNQQTTEEALAESLYACGNETLFRSQQKP